jgi:hypothetical protein
VIPLALLAMAAGAETTVQTIVRLPELTQRERTIVRAIALTAPRATEDYTRATMLGVTRGRPIRFSLMPDHVRLSLTVDGDDATPAINLTESLLRRAVLRQDDIDKVGPPQPDYWMAAIDPWAPTTGRLSQEEVRALYRKLFVPANLTVVVAGAGAGQKAISDWNRRTVGWNAPRVRQRWTPPDPQKQFTENPAGIETLTLVGKTIAARDPALPTYILALIALGSGKESLLHRVWRENNGWSYRQESILWPVPDGWQPQLVAAMPNVPADAAKKAVLSAVANWQELDRTRALGMARGILTGGVRFSPLYLSPNGPLGQDLADRAYLEAYWSWKTGTDWDADKMLNLMGMIKLDELKQTATDMVKNAGPRVLPGG